MRVQIDFPRQDAMGRVFLTWRPVRATARLIETPSGQGDTAVRLTSTSSTSGGAVVFADRLTHQGTDSIDLTLPADGTPVTFWVGGRFQKPSVAYGDVAISARELAGGAVTGPALADRPLMVRVRKDAETLSVAERDRFLSAMAALNGNGTGRFVAFREMHNADAYRQIHANISFLPWHRAYLLDIERELQIDFPEVALPYWRFDAAGQKLFQPSFIGVSDGDRVQFSATNPLRNWVAEGTTRGVKRGNGVTASTVLALRTEAACMNISTGPNANFPKFAFDLDSFGYPNGLEGDPHGNAHGGNGSGWITDPRESQKDPLFYLLHNNVDRLWAKWQWLPAGTGGARSDPARASSYYSGPQLQFGHNRDDTLWPWDGVTLSPARPRRPPHAPGGGLADSPTTPAPGQQPQVRSMIDYFGAHGGEPLGFAYDDVPFEL